MTIGLTLDPIANRELQHPRMRSHLMKEPQTLDDAVVKVDQFRFGQLVDVDFHLVFLGSSDPLVPPNDLLSGVRDAARTATPLQADHHASWGPLEINVGIDY